MISKVCGVMVRQGIGVLGLVGILGAQVPPGVEQMAQDVPRYFIFLLGSGTLTSATVHGKPFPIPRFDVGVASNIVGFRTVNPADTARELKVVGFIPMIQAEVGIWDGISAIPGVLSGIGAVDLLVRYIPPIKIFGEQTVQPNGWAWGAKIGILKDRFIPPVPAISVTALFTSWGDLESDFQQGSNYVGVRMGVRVTSLHLDISKNLLLFTPYAGIGYESGRIHLDWRTTPSEPPSTFDASFLSPHYTRLYAGLLLSPIPLVKAIGEVSLIEDRVGFSVGLKAGL